MIYSRKHLNRFQRQFMRSVFFNADAGASGDTGSGGGATTSAPAGTTGTTTTAPSGQSTSTTITTGHSASVNMTGDSGTAESSSTSFNMKPQGQTQQADTSWTEKLSDDYKGNPTVKNLMNQDVNGLVKMLLEGESKLGEMRQQMGAQAPAPDAKPEDVAKYMQGRYAPKSAAEYGFDKAPENLPEGVQFNAEEAGKFAEWAHQQGLHPQIAKAIQQFDIQRQAAAATARKEQIAQLSNEYKQKWGNQSDARLDRAGKFLTDNLPPEMFQRLGGMPPESRQMLAMVVDNFMDKYETEHGTSSMTNSATSGSHQSGVSEAQLQQDLFKIQQNPVYQNEQLDKAEHQRLREQATAISKKIAAMRGNV